MTTKCIWKYDEKKNKITFNQPLVNAEVRVYFYRGAAEAIEKNDLPIATATIKGRSTNFIEGSTPFHIQIRERKFYFFKSVWIDCECG